MLNKLGIILLFISGHAFGQALVEGSHIGISLGEVQYDLFAARDCEHCYYYLPEAFRISKKGKDLEASLITWKNDENSEIIGGILHVLIEWGPTPDMDQKLSKALVKQHDSVGVVLGPAVVIVDHVALEGSDKLCNILQESLTNSLNAPTTPGSKMGMSFRISESHIQEFLKLVKDGKSDSAIVVVYNYSLISSYGVEKIKQKELKMLFKDVFKLIEI